MLQNDVIKCCKMMSPHSNEPATWRNCVSRRHFLNFLKKKWDLRMRPKFYYVHAPLFLMWPALTWRGQELAQHVQGQLLHTSIMQAAGSSHVMELLTDSI